MVLINIDYRLISISFFFIDKFYSIVFVGQWVFNVYTYIDKKAKRSAATLKKQSKALLDDHDEK